MKAEPFFSVCVPVYNAKKYLGMCVNSILCQSEPDFELILVDDGSRDESPELCDAFADKDARVRVIHQPNGGISAASNAALDAARGVYCFFMDNDDEMCEGFLYGAKRMLEKTPVDILNTGYYRVEPGNHSVHLAMEKPQEDFEKTTDQIVRWFCDGTINPPLWTKLVRREFWLRSGVRFDPRYDSVQDAALSLQLLPAAESIVFSALDSVRWYHPREGSVSTRYGENAIWHMYWFAEDMLQAAEGWRLQRATYEKFRTRCMYVMLSGSCDIVHLNKEKQAALIAETENNRRMLRYAGCYCLRNRMMCIGYRFAGVRLTLSAYSMAWKVRRLIGK